MEKKKLKALAIHRRLTGRDPETGLPVNQADAAAGTVRYNRNSGQVRQNFQSGMTGNPQSALGVTMGDVTVTPMDAAGAPARTTDAAPGNPRTTTGNAGWDAGAAAVWAGTIVPSLQAGHTTSLSPQYDPAASDFISGRARQAAGEATKRLDEAPSRPQSDVGRVETGVTGVRAEQAFSDEAHRRRESADMTIAGQLRRARQRLALLQDKLFERRKTLMEENPGLPVTAYGSPTTPWGTLAFGDPVDAGLMQNDTEARALSHSISEVEEQIRLLESKKFNDEHASGGWDAVRRFGHSAGQVFVDEGLKTLSFGDGDMADAGTRLRINRKIERGEELTPEEEDALADEMETQQVEARVGDLGNAYTWGQIAGASPWFMAQFLGTGGGFASLGKGLGTRLARKLAERSARRAALEGGESLGMRLAEGGLMRFARTGGRKAFARLVAEQGRLGAASIAATRMLGVGATALAVRAPLMAATVQAGQTASKVVETKLGPVVADEATGELRYEDAKGWGEAAWQAGMDQVIENASEMGLTNPLGLKASDVARLVGARRLTAMLLRSTREGAGTVLSKTAELMRRGGLQGYVEEVGEEYSGQLWRTMLGLESAYTTDEAGRRVNQLTTGGFHGDIWAGLALSMGMTAGTSAAAGYGVRGAGALQDAVRQRRMTHRVETASAAASAAFGAEQWEAMRLAIDATDNADFGRLAEQVAADTEMNDSQKSAVMDYMEHAMQMRGDGLRRYVEQRDGVAQAASSPEEREAAQAWSDGYEATEAGEMQDVRRELDFQRTRLAGLMGLASAEEVDAAVGADAVGFAEAAASGWRAPGGGGAVPGSAFSEAAMDYAVARMAYEGMIRRVQDDIEVRVRESDAQVRRRTNPATGAVQQATLKVKDAVAGDRKAYVVGGTVVMLADGSGVDTQASDASITVVDGETGKVEMVSPDALLRVEEPVDAATLRAEAADQIRQELSQEAADRIDGVLHFNAGDRYVLTGADGRQVEAVVTADAAGVVENGDGTVNVTTDGGQTVAPVAKADLQAMSDATGEGRVAGFEARRSERNARQEAAQGHAYELNEEVTVRDADGNPVTGFVTDADWNDGTVLVQLDTPEGPRVFPFTREELDRARVESAGDALDSQTVQGNAPENGNNGGENIPQNGNISPQNIPASTETLQADGETLHETLQAGTGDASALERIPKDEQGQPLYEQADPETAWDAIVEQTKGDEAMAQSVADSMVADKESELKKIEKVKPKTGTTIAEKIAAERERKNDVEQAKANLALWQKIAQTSQRRKQAALAEQSKAAEEAARLRRAEEEKLRAEREEAERIRREALNGVPDFVEDTPQDARVRGFRRVNGNKVDRQQAIPTRLGNKVQVKFDDNNIPTGHVSLIDASQLQPSHINGQRNPLHFIDEAQPKERKDDASVMSAQKIAANIRPEEITSSVTAYTGAPTVNTRGEVIQGNNRSAALREMWAAYPEQAAKYKQYLTEHAADFGLAPEDVEAMRQPVLVNMLDVPDEEAIALGQFVAQDTESGGTERIKPKNLVQKMGKDMGVFANRLLASPDEESSFAELVDSNGADVLKWMQQKGYITPTQYKSAFDSKGNLTAEAKNDLKGVMYQGIFQNGSTTLEEMFGVLPAKAQKAILATAYRDYDSPNTERLNGEIQSSIQAYYALVQDPAFAEARNYKEAAMAVEAWKRQLAMDDVTGESYLPSERYSNFALLLATMYKGQSQTFIQNIFKNIYDLVQGTQETTLFETPDNTPRPLAEAVNEAVNKWNEQLLLNGKFEYNGQRRNNVLAGGSATSQQGRQGGDGSATSGGRDEGGTRTAFGDDGASNDGNSGRSGRAGGENQARTEEEEPAEERLSREEAAEIIADMEERAEVAPEMELTIENWDVLFGNDGRVNTPIGEVKMGENQFAKLMRKGRNGKLGMIKPTLEDPDIIVEDKREAKDGANTERDSSYVFVKAFIKNDGSRYYYFTSVTVSQDGKEVVVSNQEKSRNRVLRLMLEGSVIWRTPKDAATSSAEKQGLDYAHPNEAEDATKGSGITPQSTSSVHKDTDKSSVTQTIGEKVAKAEDETATNPTEAQKEAGNYKKGHVRIGQFDITVENPKGSVRSGVDANGKPWKQTMRNTYGYIRGTEGVDGDHIDVFLTNDIDGWNGRRVYIVDQYNEDGTFDEHKVMLGFNDEAEAQDSYLSNYEKGWENKHKLVLSSVNLEDFEKWISRSHRKTKPFAEYKNVKFEDIQNATNPANNQTVDSFKTKRESVIQSTIEDLQYEYATANLSKTDEEIRKEAEELVDYNEESDLYMEVWDRLESLIGSEGMDKLEADARKNGEDRLSLVAMIDEIKRREKREQEEAAKIKQQSGPVEKIKDVGEKIGGAKKDRFKEFVEKEKQIQEEPDSFMEELRKLPVSKIFNFNLEALRKDGLSNEAATLIDIIRRIISSKPRTDWKLKRWVSDVFGLYRFCLTLVTAEQGTFDNVLERVTNIKQIGGMYRAQMALGGFDSRLDTGQATLEELGDSAGHYDKDDNWVPLKGQWYVAHAGRYGGIYPDYEKAKEALSQFAGENSKGKEKSTEVKFSVYSYKNSGEAFITPKGKPNIVVESGFKNSKEALDYLNEHMDELQAKYRNMKDATSIGFFPNSERRGKDWRGGKDVTAEDFRNAFGFRGVEFGNWANQQERQLALNQAYDAFMDLSEATGISPQGLSLSGELGMAFGARGGGGAAAHYEPGKVVINLTKTQGAGTLAHEWWHAVDNYFSRRRGQALGYNTERKGYNLPVRGGKVEREHEAERKEITDAFAALMKAINGSSYGERSNAYASLKSSYWKESTELGARAFAVWVERKLSEKGIVNNFLANNNVIGWESPELTQKYYPYPLESDFESLDVAFDNLFGAIEEKVDEETGSTVLYRTTNELPQVNERFNEELQRYQDGKMDKNEMFHLGNPNGVMRTFLPDLPIVMRQRIMTKGSVKKHNIEPTALENMPQHLSEPIFVFQRTDNVLGVLTEMKDRDGKNVCVAISLSQTIQDGKNILEVNDIRSIHGRNEADIIYPIVQNNTLVWADKKKGLAWLSSASQSVQQEIDKQDLVSAANIVKNFENPSVEDENLRFGNGALTDDDLSIANDPVSKLLGKSTRTARQRKAFAERERGRMVERVRKLAEKLHLDNVEIVTDASTLHGNRAKAKGFFSRSTGKIIIVIPNHTSVFDVEQTLLHEAVAHYGLRRLFGEHFDTFLDNVFQNADVDVRRHIVELAEKRGWDLTEGPIWAALGGKGINALPPSLAQKVRTATEEYLASLAENTNFENTNASWWQKIKELFLRMLHKIGFEDFSGVTLTDNELRYILWRSYENLAEPGRYRSILGDAADVARQSALKVGNYAPRHADAGRVAEERDGELEAVNRRFNEELEKFSKGEMRSSDKFDLGNPSPILRACGLPESRIEMTQSVLRKHLVKHGISARDIEGLPSALQNPMMVYEWGDKARSSVILTDLRLPDGRKVTVSIRLEKNGERLSVNEVNSVHGKELERLLADMNTGKSDFGQDNLRYVDKGKALDWFAMASPKEASQTNPRLSSAANIARNFENPVILDVENVGSASGAVGSASEADVLFRKAEGPSEEAASEDARRLYEEAVKDTGRRSLVGALAWTAAHLGSKDARVRFRHKFSESYFDYTRSVKALQDAVEKSSGREVRDFEDTWRAMNAKSSVDEVEIQEVMFRYVEPLTKHIGRMLRGREVDGKALDMDALERYLISKHGAERNALMAGREAERLAGVRMERWRKGEVRRLVEKEGYTYDEARAIVEEEALQKEETLRAEAGREARRDYAGLTALYGEEAGKDDVDALEAAASAYCGRFEAAVGAEQAEELWRLVRALNGFSLRKAYLSGLISKRQFDEVSGMYRYYVPLRGWKDDYSGDIYQYVSRAEGSAVRQKVLRRAYGRKSRAANLVGTMSAMANTSVVQGNRNLVAQRFLNMAMNHGDAGLFKVAPLWYELRADGTWEPSLPKITEGMTAEEAERAIAEHEEKMEAAEAEGLARRSGDARGGGKGRPVADAMGMHMAKWQEREHMVRAVRNGREYAVYVLGDPKAAQAVNGLLNPDVEATAIEEVLMKFLRFKAQMQTSFSPEFMVSNFQRDVLTSTAGTYIKHGVDWARLYAGNLWRVLPMTPGKGGVPAGGIFTLVRKWRRGRLDASDEVERLFGEFVHGGGMTGISQLDDATVWQRRAERQVRRSVRGRVRNAPGEAVRGFMRAVEEVNRGVENATRFAAYMTARQRGLTVTDAIAEAKDVSVNFNRKGSGAWGNLWMRRNIIYANAALQSLYMLGTWYGASPRRFMGVMGATLAASMATAMVWYLVGGGDGDDEGNDWYGLSEWNRYNYINLRGPEGYFHWNIPQELRPAWALGQIAFDLSTGRITQERALHSMAMQLNNVTPVSFIAGGTDTGDSWITSGIKAWTPTVAADFIDAYAWNADFLGRRITGKASWNATSPEWRRVTEETPAWAVSASRGWNRLTGGRDNRKSWWDSEWLNPGALYYILMQQAGGMGQLVTKTTKMVEQWRSPDEEVEARYVPFVSKFYVTTGDDYSKHRVLNDRFYQLWREYELAEHEVKANARDLREGRMTEEEYDEALRQMRDDGSLGLFERIYAEGLDLDYEHLLEYVRENPDDKAAREMLTGLKRHVLEVCGPGQAGGADF